MNKIILIGGIIGMVLVILIGGIMFMSLGDESSEERNERLFMEQENPKGLEKPQLPKAEMKSMINGEEIIIEERCNSQVLKCTKLGCEEVCL